MKIFIFLFLATTLFVYQKWGYISSIIDPPPDYAALHNGKVIVYGTSWCGYCAKTRKLLNRNNIAFYEYDVEKSQEGYEQYKNLGGTGVPVLLIGGQVVKGYNPSRILELANQI